MQYRGSIGNSVGKTKKFKPVVMNNINKNINKNMNDIKVSKNQEYFDTLVPKYKDWFNSRETARIIGRSDQFVRNAIDEGILKAQSGGCGKRKNSVVHRDDLILFLVRTASYDEGDCIREVKDILRRRFGPSSLRIIKEFIQFVLNENHSPPVANYHCA